MGAVELLCGITTFRFEDCAAPAAPGEPCVQQVYINWARERIKAMVAMDSDSPLVESSEKNPEDKLLLALSISACASTKEIWVIFW